MTANALSAKQTTKTIFMRNVKNTFEKYNKKESCCIHFSKIFERTKTDIKNKVLRITPYEVCEERGVEKLILKKRGPNGLIVEVLPFEELFDILYELHIKNDHKCLDLAPLMKNYKYPAECLSILKRSCPHCLSMIKNKKNEEENLNVGSVFIVPINIQSKNNDDHFRYMLIYVHKTTNFIVLRPLTEKQPLEISVELLKIVTEYQPPHYLWIHGYNIKLYEDIRASFIKIWPLFNIGFEHKPPEYSITSAVVSRLNMLHHTGRHASWVVLLPYIQKTMNLKATTHGVRTVSCIGPHYELLTRKLDDNFGRMWTQLSRDDLQVNINEDINATSEVINTDDDLFETDDFIDNVIVPDLIEEETIMADRHNETWTNPEWERNVEILSTMSLAENEKMKKE